MKRALETLDKLTEIGVGIERKDKSSSNGMVKKVGSFWCTTEARTAP